MDVEPALRFLNAYATHSVWRWERPIEMTFCFEPGPPNCFLALRAKEGSPLRGYVQRKTPDGRSLLAACRDTSQEPKSGCQKSSRRGLRLGSRTTFVI